MPIPPLRLGGAVAKWSGRGLQNLHTWVRIPSAPQRNSALTVGPAARPSRADATGDTLARDVARPVRTVSIRGSALHGVFQRAGPALHRARRRARAGRPRAA